MWGIRKVWLRRSVRCYNCGQDYRRQAEAVCPRCGDARVMKRGAPFNDNPGSNWKLMAGSSPYAAGEAARALRDAGIEASREDVKPRYAQ